MKELKEYERYIIYSLLLILLISVIWLISSKSNVGRYQCCSAGDGAVVWILDTKTSHLWVREESRLTDLGTIEKPYRKRGPHVKLKYTIPDTPGFIDVH